MGRPTVSDVTIETGEVLMLSRDERAWPFRGFLGKRVTYNAGQTRLLLVRDFDSKIRASIAALVWIWIGRHPDV
jgi:hypothetical protein